MAARHRWIGAAGAIGILALAGMAWSVADAKCDPVRVTVEQPGVVSLVSAPRRITLEVKAFQPASDGPVEIVVGARRGGAERELYRFGVFPETPFAAAEASQTQTFAVAVPADLADGQPFELSIRLVPMRGTGSGALIEIGEVGGGAERRCG